MQKRYYLTPFILLLLLISATNVLAERKNRLLNHASPYLAMHGKDPVQWQDWGAEAQQAARDENKLLFVSSGYFSCHWCHVMQRESYRNVEIARLLNEHFIAVKLDRELNPALDAKLIDFVERTQGHAGWPLNVFITPDGYPLVGMVYLPPENFRQVLENINSRWRKENTELKAIAKQATAELRPAKRKSGEKLPRGISQHYNRLFISQVFELADEMQGGFGQENKFPSVPQLLALLNLETEQQQHVRQFLQLSLDQMASQGLNDQLSGGFFRYTVDPNWQVPHFEKMLYDNAQLARLYLAAAKKLNRPEYRQVAFRTLDFMIRELGSDKGGLAASLSAIDRNGIEGGAYLWHNVELERLLSSEEWNLVRRIWGLEGSPELEAGHHLVLNMSLEDAARQVNLPFNKAKRLFESAKAKMILLRGQRGIPRDDKKLASWNALALTAMLHALNHEEGAQYRQAAQDLHRYLTGTLWNGESLSRAEADGRFLGQAGLEDYAYLAEALWYWAKMSGDKKDYELASRIAKSGWQRFYAEQGWQLTENSWLKYANGETLVADSVLPSASAVLTDISLRLALHQGDQAWRHDIMQTLTLGSREISEEPFWYASQIMLLQQIQETRI